MRRREDTAVRRAKAAYNATEREIRRKQAALLARIRDAEASGELITATSLILEERYTALLDQLDAATAKLAADCAPLVATAQQAAVTASAQAAERAAFIASGLSDKAAAAKVGVVWNRLPVEALDALVGYAGDGSPLADLFEAVGKGRAEAVRDALFAGVGRGASSREIARDLQAVSGISRQRAMLIARTETNRAMRAATLETYRQNPKLLAGWIWRCACDTRSCPACWAMHGTEHGPNETFGSHPACRCYAVPKIRDLRTSPDQPDVRPKIEPGADRFARLSKGDQKAILGPGAHALYEGGSIALTTS